jgi:FkbM family methyltransferase
MEIEEIKSRDGFVYYIEKDDLLYKNRLQAGSWQNSNWRFAQTLIDNWTRCVDVGSNMGCSAVLYSQRFQHVECFEPTPDSQTLWDKTITANKITNCYLHAVAVGECRNTTTIIHHERNGGHNHLDNSQRPRWTGSKWVARTPKPRQRKTYEVEVYTLDSFGFTDVGFIKIDVEGYEKFVLEGAQQTIANSRPTLQLEIRANQCRKFGYWAEDMIDWIRSLDYVVMSKKSGRLDGTFNSQRNDLLYNGIVLRQEMDIFFQPRERMRKTKFDDLFKLDVA